jgi:hypothetical protein
MQEGDTIEVDTGIMRTVTMFEFSGGPGHSAALSCGVNVHGQVAFEANFTGGARGILIANNPTNYAQWAYPVMLPPGLDDPEDDANGDGVPNVAAYYLGVGGHEMVDWSDLVTWSLNGSALEVKFDHDLSVTDVTVAVAVADSLDGAWAPGPALSVIDSNEGTETLQATIPTIGDTGFARLVFTVQ